MNRRGHTKSHPQAIWRIARRRQIREGVVHTISNFLETYAKGMFFWVVMILKELERQDERLTDENTMIHAAPPTRRKILFLYYVQMLCNRGLLDGKSGGAQCGR